MCAWHSAELFTSHLFRISPLPWKQTVSIPTDEKTAAESVGSPTHPNGWTLSMCTPVRFFHWDQFLELQFHSIQEVRGDTFCAGLEGYLEVPLHFQELGDPLPRSPLGPL